MSTLQCLPAMCKNFFVKVDDAITSSLHLKDIDGHRDVLEQKHLMDRANKILGLLNESTQDPIIQNACRHAIEITFESMNDEVSKSIEDLQSNYSSDDIKRFHVLLELKRQRSFLDVVEHVLTTLQPELALLISSQLNSIGRQLKEIEPEKSNQDRSDNHGVDMNQVSISAWRAPMIVFDIAVARPIILYSSPQPENTCQINSGLAAAANITKGKKELPYRMEVRTITSIFTEETVEDLGTGQCQLVHKSEESEQRAYNMQIHRCVHVARQYSDVGDMTLLLSLSSIGNFGDSKLGHEPLRVKMARAIQMNAAPPRIDTALDLFTSSAEGNEELTIFVRFQTRPGLDDEYPKIVVELTV